MFANCQLMKYTLPTLLSEIKNCKICEEHLPLPPRPVMTASKKSKIVLIGQAPGTHAHNSEKPWNDKSGDRLRNWLDVDEDTFYDPDNFANLPMGFCYPGKNPKSGDLPPRKECAPQWHETVLQQLKHVELIILIGNYSQKYYLKKSREKNLTETVRRFENYLPEFFPLVHPSPLNYRWMGKNAWFEKDVIPVLKKTVKEILE